MGTYSKKGSHGIGALSTILKREAEVKRGALQKGRSDDGKKGRAEPEKEQERKHFGKPNNSCEYIRLVCFMCQRAELIQNIVYEFDITVLNETH